FEDYTRCQVEQSSEADGSGRLRRLEVPSWVMDFEKMQRLLIEFAENRAFSKKQRRELSYPPDLAPIHRLNIAQGVIIAKTRKFVPVLDSLCREYVSLKNLATEHPYRAKRLSELEVEIKAVDTTLRFSRSAVAVATAIAFLYYRVGCDSVSVGAVIGTDPRHVRQTLWRLNRCWENLTGEKPLAFEHKQTKKEGAKATDKPARLCSCGTKLERLKRICPECWEKKYGPKSPQPKAPKANPPKANSPKPKLMAPKESPR